MMDKCYFKPHDAKISKPDVDEIGISDFVVVFTSNGERELAFWNSNTGLWYSESDPTGFGNVVKWSAFIEPNDFAEDKETYNFGGRYGEV